MVFGIRCRARWVSQAEIKHRDEKQKKERKWTEDADQDLADKVKTYNYDGKTQWAKVLFFFSGVGLIVGRQIGGKMKPPRTADECEERWEKLEKKKKKKGKESSSNSGKKDASSSGKKRKSDSGSSDSSKRVKLSHGSNSNNSTMEM